MIYIDLAFAILQTPLKLLSLCLEMWEYIVHQLYIGAKEIDALRSKFRFITIKTLSCTHLF